LIDLGLPPFENSYTRGVILVNKLLDETNAKVIVLTGQENDTYPQELLELGVFDYLQKPTNMQTLLESLRRAEFFIDNVKKTEESYHISFDFPLHKGLKEVAEMAQKQLLQKVLAKNKYNITKTAKELGISRENCHYFLKKLSIETH